MPAPSPPPPPPAVEQPSSPVGLSGIEYRKYKESLDKQALEKQRATNPKWAREADRRKSHEHIM